MRLRITFCCLLLNFALLTTAQAPTASPAAQQLKHWLTAFNGSDWDAYLTFVQENFVTPPEPMYVNRGFREGTGGFYLKKIETETATSVTALLQERDSEQTARIVVEVAAAEPHRIVKLQAQPIPLPHFQEKDLLPRTRQRIEELVSADRFAGTVLVAQKGRPISAQAYGFADRERHISNSLQTRFGLASMGKMFTGVAVLQLVKAGKIGLDDPIEKYLTDYPNKELASKVTIRQLLSHTGGTGNIFGPEFNKHRLELRTHEDYIHLFGSRPVRFEPGSRWEYSNYGFVILGVVIDRVSGQGYYDYIRDHVFTPAGMTSTDTGSDRITGAGGGRTTVEDLLRFANALQDNKLLDAHYTELLTTGHVATPGGGKYAYGFEDRIVNGTRCFGHDGAGADASGDLKICPQGNYVVAVLANMNAPAAQRISNFIAGRLPEPRTVGGK
jgi:CubicO group peptidase (beta-lactamase class C family)